MFKKDKRYQSFKEEKKDFQGDIRALIKQVKHLRRENSRLRKYEEFCMQDENFVKKHKENRIVRKNKRILAQELFDEKPSDEQIKCSQCNTFNVEVLHILNKIYTICKECNNRTKVEINEKTNDE